MVYPFIKEFSRREGEMGQHKGRENPVARELAERNGYEFVGMGHIPLGTTQYTAMVVERATGFGPEAVEFVLQVFRERGYPVKAGTIAYRDGAQVMLNLILAKHYEGGRTATMESPGSLEERPIAMIGHKDGKTRMAYFANTADMPEVEEIAEDLDMLPASKTDIPGAFLDAFRDSEH